MLQSRFTDDRGRIYVFNKKAPENGVFETTPTNAFVQRHIYSFVNKDGTKDPTLERFYADLEGRANKIIEKIVDAAWRKNPPADPRRKGSLGSLRVPPGSAHPIFMRR
jgi:hypothetical protein